MKPSSRPPRTPCNLLESCTCLLVLCVLLSGVGHAAPSITISKKSGPPTSQILVSGRGFERNVGVDTYFDAKDEALIVTDKRGEFDNARAYAPHRVHPGGCHCLKVKASADVLSAQSTEHPWLRSRTFAQDMAAFSPALNKVLTSIQTKVSEHKIKSAQCMGKFGGGFVTEDGGFIVYELVRDDQHWELEVTQFDKAAADAFRERVKSGKTDIDPQKEFFADPDARLVIDGANWTIYQGEQLRSGTIAEK
jgi:hypothetical protein